MHYDNWREEREAQEKKEHAERIRNIRIDAARDAAKEIRRLCSTATAEAAEQQDADHAEALLNVSTALLRVAIKLERGDLGT